MLWELTIKHITFQTKSLFNHNNYTYKKASNNTLLAFNEIEFGHLNFIKIHSRNHTNVTGMEHGSSFFIYTFQPRGQQTYLTRKVAKKLILLSVSQIVITFFLI